MGLEIASGSTPSASAIARTSRVLPAPRGPTSPITTPGSSNSARARPSRVVSSSEASWMFRPSGDRSISMRGPSLTGAEVVEPTRFESGGFPRRCGGCRPRVLGDLADAMEPGREGRCGQEPIGVLGRKRQAELEVLAVVERVFERGDAVARGSFSGRQHGSGSPTASRIAPSPPLSSRIWPRSEESPSERSIMAWIGAASCRARASAIRGSGLRWRPANRLPPSGPVTRIASPGLAAPRRTAPRAPSPGRGG